ncbi:MAG: hypothetical protein AB7O31_00260 [Burkholderiales bacterium]
MAHEMMTAEERELLPNLKEEISAFAARSYAEVAEMLRTHDTHTDGKGEFIWIEAQPIQNLGADQGDQIEVSVSVRGREAHIGAYIYFAPNGAREFSPKVYRRPADPTITYNVCELEDLSIEQAPSNP